MRNPWHEMTSTLFKTPWKVDHLGAIQWTLRRKTDSIQISWGQRKNQMMSHQSSSKLCLTSDNDKEKTFLSINRWMNLQIILEPMLFKDNPWSSALQQQLMSNAAIERYFHIFILVYHLQHGYDLWTMLSHSCMCMNAGRMHPPRLTVGPFVVKLKCTLHRMNMGDNMNIIDDAKTVIFTIWFDKLRGLHREIHRAYNDELFTAKHEIHVWMTW